MIRWLLRRMLGREFLADHVNSAISQLSRPTVVVTTRDDRTFVGVLVGAHRDVLVLAHSAALIPADGGRVGREQLAGELTIPRENVSFLQLDPKPLQEVTS
jgi:small nuclear ribonucleoprotein (snRNP)-like protein